MRRDVAGLTLFTMRRRGRLLAAGVYPYGVNLHRAGGVSFTGIPRRGGTTVCWGRMRRQTAVRQANAEWQGHEVEVTRYEVGPLEIRVGADF